MGGYVNANVSDPFLEGFVHLTLGSLSWGVCIAALYPVFYYTTLQRVGLLPAWPMLPPLSTLQTSLSVVPLSDLGKGSLILALRGILKNFMDSPLPWYCLLNRLDIYVRSRIEPIIVGCLLPTQMADPENLYSAPSSDHHSPSGLSSAVFRVLSMFGWVLPARSHSSAKPAHIARDPLSNLSLYPRWELALGCTVTVCRWAALPLWIMVVRRTVAHFIARSGLSDSSIPFPLFDPLGELRKGNLGTIGVLIYRTLLCEALKTAVTLGISECRVVVCRYIGQRCFSWGNY